MLSPASAVPRRHIESSPTLPGFEAPPSQHPERSIWVDLAWDVLCWGASLLWTALRWVALLLWAALKLPWRALGAILRWCEGLDYEAVFVAWRIGLATALVGVPLYLWMVQPAWLFDPLRVVLPVAEVSDSGGTGSRYDRGFAVSPRLPP